MARTRLDFVHAFDGAQGGLIGSKPLKGVCRHSQDFARANLVCGVPDERGLRLLTVNLDHLHAHTSLQTIGFATVKITRETPAKPRGPMISGKGEEIDKRSTYRNIASA